MGLMSI